MHRIHGTGGDWRPQARRFASGRSDFQGLDQDWTNVLSRHSRRSGACPTSTSMTSRALEPVQALASRVGRDPLLAQASTGNISIKLDGMLWVKASGKWMARADHDDFLIPLHLGEVCDCLGRAENPAEHFARTSIETSMHAVLPHRVVLHVHSINAIAWAVRVDARAQLAERLAGLRWQWIPYVHSGLPLAGEI